MIPLPSRAAASDPAPRRRLDALDAARGAALVAMTAYHATWDLGFLKLTPESYALTPPGKLAAHGIAAAFLFLVGIGLVLMNRDGLRPRAFLLRLARIGGAALLITGATWIAFRDSYIFFGILHCIAVSSALAAPFALLPWPVTAAAAALALAAPHLVSAPVLDAPALFFIGLGADVPRTNDYVPLLPWLGMVLSGVAATRLFGPRLSCSAMARWRADGALGRGLAFAGRHSLAVYLIHQPVLLAALTGLVALTGPHPRAGLSEFRAEYGKTCLRGGGEPDVCRIAARCVSEALRREGLWAIEGRPFTVDERATARRVSDACHAAAE